MSFTISAAEDKDIEEISKLVNSAYRGESARAGWATEADLIGGQRTDPDTLRQELARPVDNVILCLRDEPGGPIKACVLLEKREAGKCYLGMLTVKPGQQNAGIGRQLLEYSERYAREWGATRMEMTVLMVRHALIEWYERRGYRQTGHTEPFPYGNEKYGEPRVQGLYFIVLEKSLTGEPS